MSAADSSLEIPLEELPFLQAFGLMLDSEGAVKSRFELRAPEGKAFEVPEAKAGKSGLVKIRASGAAIEIVADKPWRIGWSFFEKQWGREFAAFLQKPADGSEIAVSFAAGKKTLSFRGVVKAGIWRVNSIEPEMARATLAAAWEIARTRFDKKVACADDGEAEALTAAIAKDKYLRDMDVKRTGRVFRCAQDEGQLTALLVRLRHGPEWGFPDLAKRKTPRKDATHKALETWRKQANPGDAALALFEAIEKELSGCAVAAKLARKTQELPPKLEMFLPPLKRGGHEWSFGSVAAMGNDVYFELHPLGIDANLRNLVSPALGKCAFRPDDGFKLDAAGGAKFLPEISALVAAASEWFGREVLPTRPAPPCQFLDQYLIEPAGWPADHVEADDDDAPGLSDFAATVKHEPLAANDSFRDRLARALGKGDWRCARLEIAAMLPDWGKACRVELHACERAGKKPVREGWKIKRFLPGAPKPKPCDLLLRYAVRSEFTASLERGRAYRCSATLGVRFQQYVRIRDESGEEYWYPERFFVDAGKG
ncbi:MAG TPA: hypothetical protein VNC50_06380 [Planctomycetia bacterium]|nr:hypothetical protein [Planctomycetia bacterium]